MAGAERRAREWVLEWFSRNGPAPGGPPEPRLRTNYFEAGLIDSLAVVRLVAEAEKAFAIRFEDQHYQDPRFSTLGGLAEIVSELSAAKRPSKPA